LLKLVVDIPGESSLSRQSDVTGNLIIAAEAPIENDLDGRDTGERGREVLKEIGSSLCHDDEDTHGGRLHAA
jgi:hypothetical protein